MSEKEHIHKNMGRKGKNKARDFDFQLENEGKLVNLERKFIEIQPSVIHIQNRLPGNLQKTNLNLRQDKYLTYCTIIFAVLLNLC